MVINDYLYLQEVAQKEKDILEFNRVGVEKNLKKILEQTAEHCGLRMAPDGDRAK